MRTALGGQCADSIRQWTAYASGQRANCAGVAILRPLSACAGVCEAVDFAMRHARVTDGYG